MPISSLVGITRTSVPDSAAEIAVTSSPQALIGRRIQRDAQTGQFFRRPLYQIGAECSPMPAVNTR